MRKPIRILFVSDSPDETVQLEHEIKRGGYFPEIVRVDSPERMADALDDVRWDVVISDYSLSEFNSLAALNVLKRSGWLVPFIVLSGAVGEEMAVAMMKAGVNDYILKTNLSRIVPVIERELREARQRRQHHAMEELQKGRNKVLERLASGSSLEDVLLGLIESVEAARPGMLCSVLLLDREKNLLKHGAAPSLPDFYVKSVDGLEVGPGVGSCGTAAYTGGRVVVEDVRTHPFWIKYRKLAERAGLRACWSEPLRSSAGITLGTLAMYYREPKAPDADDLDLIRQAANLAGIAIQRKQTEDALLASEERYRTLIDTMSEGLAVVDKHGTITYANNRTCEMVGRTREEMTGLAVIDLVDEKNRGVLERRLQKRRFTERDSYELDWIGEAGRRISTLVSPRAVYDKDNNYDGFIAVITDITELKQLEERVAQAEKMELLGRLAGTVAHDLNNVLSGLVTYPDLLLMQVPRGNPMRPPLESIKEAGERASAIVEDLLTLARRGVPASEIVNLNHVVSEYLDSREHKLLLTEHPDVRIESTLEPALLNTQGSSLHLTQSVVNLVNNAVEAMPDGGRLEISTYNEYLDRPVEGYDDVTEGKYVVLRVSDSGTGIPQKDKRRIFEPFYTRKVMGRSGTGLGLTVVWGTVNDHGGYIGLESAVGEGTTFRLYFPAVIRKKDERPSAEATASDHDNSSAQLLVVDDASSQRDLACRTLTSLGYSAEAVASGEDAVRLVKKQRFDMVLLDMMMGDGMDGLDTYRRILEIRPGQKAIIVSGCDESERIREALKLGAGSFVRKPYAVQEIDRVIRSELSR